MILQIVLRREREFGFSAFRFKLTFVAPGPREKAETQK
jgi:hypothetical protein